MNAAQTERLVILIEECGEVIQAATKCLRHGYESVHPDAPTGDNNRRMLEQELGDLAMVGKLMMNKGDVDRFVIMQAELRKQGAVKPYLHHQT